MKRIIAIFLVSLMVLSFTACSAPTSEPEISAVQTAPQSIEPTVPVLEDVELISLPGEIFSPVPRNEVTRAISYGIVPEELQRNYNDTITYAELCTLISSFLAKYDSTKLPEWKVVAENALMSNRQMHRDDGMVAIYKLAEVLNMEMLDWTGWPSPSEDIVVAGHWYATEQYIDLQSDFSKFSLDYNEFPGWDERKDTPPQGSLSNVEGGYLFVATIKSYLSKNTMMDIDYENRTMHPDAPLTREDAIKAILRLAEFHKYPFITGCAPKYVSVYDVGTYDKSIIIDELLNQSSNLPELSQANLPTTWKGAGITARKDAQHTYQDFCESDIRFLSESGFNFTRLFLGLDKFQYPYYSEDKSLVNEYELKELDRLIAWCIEYDVHLQISMAGLPNRVMVQGGNYTTDYSEIDWELITAYWEMLSRRYAEIPTKYLSFDLMNEGEPNEHTWDRWKTGWENTVQRVRAADDDRVLLYSYSGTPNLDWMDEMASLGLAIGCHPYYPTWFCAGDANGDYTWPLAYDDNKNPIPTESDYIDADAVYEHCIVPQQAIAEKYNVGFMVNEMGNFQTGTNWPAQLMVNYQSDILRMLEQHELSWCLCEAEGWPYRFLTAPVDKWEWSGLETELCTYTYDDGKSESFYINKTLLNVFINYTLAK